MKSTPGPWGINFNGKCTWTIEQIGGDGQHIGKAERQQDARFIVTACNCHEELLACLKLAVARIELANAEGNNIMSAWLPDAKAVIAKAEGGK